MADRRHVEHAMGTVFSFEVHAPALDATQLDAAIEQACAVLHDDEAVFSLWREDTPMSRLARGELRFSDAPAEVREVRDRCLEVRSATSGWFDPWYDRARFDPTGFVKGWSAGRALAVLRDAGVTSAMLNAGGDVATIGDTPAGSAWRIGVRDPDDETRIRLLVDSPGAVATSGLYERGEHVRDPRSGGVATGAVSASVAGPDIATADAIATALLCSGVHGLAMFDEFDDYSGCVIDAAGAAHASAGFPFSERCGRT